MSTVEEDVELRELVAQTLEKNGCLAKIRAELRASIFLALEEDIKLSKQEPLHNLRIQSYLGTPEGRVMFCLVREFLEFFNLQFTISVYEPESYLDSIYHYEGRQKIAKDLGLENVDESTVPLLQHLLKIAQEKNKIIDINLNVDNNINSSLKEESLNVDSSYKKTESECVSSNITSNILVKKNEQLNATFDVNTPFNNNTSQENKRSIEKGEQIKEDHIKEVSLRENSGSLLDISKNSEIPHSICKSDNQNCHIETELQDKQFHLNQTFDVNSPTLNYIETKSYVENVQNHINLRNINEDDTYEDTSSIAEDIEIPTISSLKLAELTVHQPDITLNKMSDSQMSVSNKAKIESEKNKNSSQKSKGTLSCLSDLPPLSTNKTRISNQILPSPYNKEFKDKSNLKELDKFFDIEAEYEEDFTCGSTEISLSNSTLHSVQPKQRSNNSSKSEVTFANESPHSSSSFSSKIRSYKKSHIENGNSLAEHSLSD